MTKQNVEGWKDDLHRNDEELQRFLGILSDESVTGPPDRRDLDYNPGAILKDDLSQVPGKLIGVHHLALIAMSCFLGRFRNTDDFIHWSTIVGSCWANKVINFWYLNLESESDKNWHTQIDDLEVISLSRPARSQGRKRRAGAGEGKDKEADKPEQEGQSGTGKRSKSSQ
jgi:hypothetical protein